MLPEELLGKADIPRIIIISVSITGVILLLFNVLLVACFIVRKKNKKTKKGMLIHEAKFPNHGLKTMKKSFLFQKSINL